MGIRPILDAVQRTPWVADIPVDGVRVGSIVPDQVQIAFVGDGPMSSRRLVPLTPAARSLLAGPSREAAGRVIRGMLATIDGSEGVSNLRGMSLSTDAGAFATNLLMSNIEAGFVADSISTGERARLERDFESLGPSATRAKAQNTGWMDLGPRASALTRSLIEHGAAAGTAAVQEATLTFAHELQHSVTPPDPRTIDERHEWLEEGIAETIAWWPGVATGMARRMGVAGSHLTDPDPVTAPPESVATREYRDRHVAVMALLDLAGVSPRREDGSVDPAAIGVARQLLQSDAIERVPRTLARAIAARHGVSSPHDRAALADMILDVRGAPERVDALARAIGVR